MRNLAGRQTLKRGKARLYRIKAIDTFPSNSLANVSVWQIRMSVSPIGKLVWVTEVDLV